MRYKSSSDIKHYVSLDPSFFNIKEKLGDMLIKGSTTETLLTELKKPKIYLYKDMPTSQKKISKKLTNFNSVNSRNAEKIVQLLKTYQSFRDFIKVNHIDDNSLKKAANYFDLIFQPKGSYLYKETDNISNFYCIIDGKISMRKERFVKKENKNTKKVKVTNKIKFDNNITKIWRNKLKYIQYNDNMLNLFLNGIISFSVNRDKYKSNYNSINNSTNNLDLNLNKTQDNDNNTNTDLSKLNNQIKINNYKIDNNDSNKTLNCITPSSDKQFFQSPLNHSPKTSNKNLHKRQGSFPIHESNSIYKPKTSKKINKRFEKNNLYNKLMNLYRNDDYTTYQEDLYTEENGFCFGPLGLIYLNHLSLSTYCLKDTYFISLTEEEFDYCFSNCIQNSEEVRKIFLQNNICNAQLNKNPQLNLNININSILSISNPILCNIGDTVYEEGKKAEKIYIVYVSGFSLNKKIKCPYINNNFIEKNYRILNLNKGSIIGLESLYENSGCYKYTLKADCAGEVGIVICLELRKLEEDLIIKLKSKFYEYYQILEKTCTMSLDNKVDCINKVKNKFNFEGDTNNKSPLDENKIIIKSKDNYLSDSEKVKKKLDRYFNNLMSTKMRSKVYFQQPLYENKFVTVNKKNDHKLNSPFNNKYGAKIEEKESANSKITFIKQIPKNYKSPSKMKSFYNLKSISYTSQNSNNSILNLNSVLCENKIYNSEYIKENLKFIGNRSINDIKHLDISKNNSTDIDKTFINKLHKYNSFNKKINSSLYKLKFNGLFNSFNSRQNNLSMEKISQTKETLLSNIKEFNISNLGDKCKNRNKFLGKSHSTSFTNFFENNKEYTFRGDECNNIIRVNKEINKFIKGILPRTKLMKKIIRSNSSDIISNTGSFNLPLVSNINK